MAVRILGISGRKSSGKTTVYKNLYYQSLWKGSPCSYEVRDFSLAKPLKKFCIDYLGLSPSQCFGDESDKNTLTDIRWESLEAFGGGGKIGPVTAREVMEVWGTNIFRRMDPDFWLDKTLRDIAKVESKFGRDTLAVIPDVRFPNEVEGILGAGGLVIRLTRNPHGATSEAECALDEDRYDWSRFSHVCRNDEMSVGEQMDDLKPWFQSIGILN